MILSVNDFDGVFLVAKNQYTEPVLEYTIDTVEHQILVKLLGLDLANLFVSDLLNGVPQTQRFLDIFNEFQINVGCADLHSEGIKIMLLGFTYFDYVNEQSYRNTMSGHVRTNNDLSVPAIPYSKLIKAYNRSIATYQIIQAYVIENIDVYPEFKGSKKTFHDGF